MASISAVIATGFSLNRCKSPKRLFTKSGLVRKLLFKEFPLNVDAAFETRRTFPGSALWSFLKREILSSFSVPDVSIFQKLVTDSVKGSPSSSVEKVISLSKASKLSDRKFFFRVCHCQINWGLLWSIQVDCEWQMGCF